MGEKIRSLTDQEKKSQSKKVNTMRNLSEQYKKEVCYKPYGNTGERKDEGFYFLENK